MSAELKREIERIKGLNTEHDRSSLKEGTTQTVIVMPVLTALGWATDNPAEINQEIKAGGRVDIGLHINEEPFVFIEVKPGKQRRLTDRNKEQLLEYCGNRKVRLGVLTNGFVWYLYSDAESKATKPNDYAVEINFDDSIKDIEESLESFLSQPRVRHGYESVLRDLYDKRIDRILSGKWEDMLQKKHEGLARALWEEMKDEPLQEPVSLDRVKKFIRQCSNAPEGKKPDAVSEGARRVSTSPKRRDLLRLLQKEPQATDVRVGEVLGITRSGAYSALRRAETAGHIRRMKQGQVRTCQVLVDPDSGVNSETDAERSQRRTQERSAFETRAAKTRSARRKDKPASATTRALLALLKQEPSAPQARVAQVLGITPSGAYAALKRAEKVGHIRKSKHGRRCTYEVITGPDL